MEFLKAPMLFLNFSYYTWMTFPIFNIAIYADDTTI